MTARQIETPLGDVVFHGRDTGRPVQLVFTAAFARAHQLHLQQARFPEMDVWRAHLPGNHAPALVTVSIGAFGAAYSHALRGALKGRQVTTVGISAGALVALALDPALVRAHVLVDPPLRPSEVWPFQMLSDSWPEGSEDLVWRIFGVAPGRTEPRDYTVLLDRLRAPTLALVGGVALGQPRAFDEYPSLVDEVSLARLRAHPLVDVEVFEGCGHYLMGDEERFMAAVGRMCPEATN